MKRVRVATISYINSIPFVYGLTHSENSLSADLLLHTPSRCVQAFIDDECDIAIVPVGALDTLGKYKIVSSYCISSSYDVHTVALMSNSPIEDIKKIYVDSDSRTSAKLIKILARDYWHITPEYEEINGNGLNPDNYPRETGFMLIGDKVFEAEKHFTYFYDLVSAWNKMTALPFVFAVWVAKESVSETVINALNNSLEFGLKSIDQAIAEHVKGITHNAAKEYLTKNIEYTLTQDKRRAIELFLSSSDSAEPSSYI
ncbi:MAG: menaquinone biosynthesis protein [Rikenellaceae bacterium]